MGNSISHQNASKKMVLLCTLILFCTSSCIQYKGDEFRDPNDHFRGYFTVKGNPFLNNEIEIVFTVHPLVEMRKSKIEIFLPDGIQLLQEDAYWKGVIRKNEAVNLKIRVKPVQTGQFEIITFAEGYINGEYEKFRDYHLFFFTTRFFGIVGRTPFLRRIPISRYEWSHNIPAVMVMDSPPDPTMEQEIELTFLLIASQNLHIEAEIELPQKFILVNGPLKWTGDLKKEKRQPVIHITVMPVESGRFWITGIIRDGTTEEKYSLQIYIDRTDIQEADPFKGDFTVAGTCALNREVTVVFTVSPIWDMEYCRITICLPEEIALVKGDTYWSGSVKRNERTNMKMVVTLLKEGQSKIKACVEGISPDGTCENMDYPLYFYVSENNGETSKTRFYYEQYYQKVIEETGICLGLKPPSVLHIPRVDKEVALTFFIAASKDISEVTAEISLPDGIILVDGSLVWTGDLEKGKEKTFQVTVKPTRAYRFKILGFLLYNSEESKFAEESIYVYYLFVKNMC